MPIVKEQRNKKGWKVKCFGCNHKIKKNELFYRDGSGIYCELCYWERRADNANADYDQYLEEKWHRDHPNTNREQYLIDQANLRKYGEY